MQYFAKHSFEKPPNRETNHEIKQRGKRDYRIEKRFKILLFKELFLKLKYFLLKNILFYDKITSRDVLFL